MSPPASLEFVHQAPELIDNIIKQLNEKRDLSNARLTCKLLDKHAARELFRNVHISPSEEHVTSWNSIGQDEVIRRIPRHAIIHTHPDLEDHGAGVYREPIDDDDVVLSFKNALATLSRFPNLRSLEIAFTPECVGRKDAGWNDVAEDIEQRKEDLTLIFQAIKDRATDEKSRTIRELTISNLQNCPIPEFTSSGLFRDVMSQLEELHILITQEYNEHGPDHDYTRVELQTFPAYFCSHWLAPIAENLKALSIYGRENWGPFPGYFDPSSISFPKLETLALGYYTLAYDDALDWVFAVTSLRKLILHNCMIASWLRIYRSNMEQWNIRMHDWTKMQDATRAGRGDWSETFAYGGRWSQHFDRIAADLPNLVDFQFGYADSYSEHPSTSYGVTHRDSCLVEIFLQRYVCFNNGILPTHWPEPSLDSRDGQLSSWLKDGFPIDVQRESLDADRKSLDALLLTLRSRR
ncbi:uncharacterized protein ALTATR162_LOCUS10952 [Alternaria atra]|uniref:F-box domain-containing protein n=1 Tax=Alternaria atra TaxID=119953 RepID=A0A8J2IM07_9PLEO|nr:uncharacterized protein ALTATR162_LOCUS10952 [Alternaria atra]CAG5184524.1 unnamed protein product [Alternaria atra]